MVSKTTLLAISLALVSTLCGPSLVRASGTCDIHDNVRPLGDLIAQGEGDWNSVNRGYAGDTPGGMVSLTGKPLTAYTVNDVIAFQRTWLFAVGRYQFIPSTLQFAVENSEVSTSDLFTPETQDRLFVALIEHKRPLVAAYIRGQHNNLTLALDELSKEWASIEYRWGNGYYDHVGNNRAHIMRSELIPVLQGLRSQCAK